MTIAELMAKEAMQESEGSVFFKKTGTGDGQGASLPYDENSPFFRKTAGQGDAPLSPAAGSGADTPESTPSPELMRTVEETAEPDTSAPRDEIRNPPLAIEARLRKMNMLVAGSQQNVIYTDEYRRVKRPLLSNAFGKTSQLVEKGNLILITSSIPGEGKTYSAVNLALSMAQERDHTVLLVDCDVARKGASKLLGADDHKGLVEVLDSETTTIGDVIISTDIPSLSMIPAGKPHDYVTELLASHRMQSVVEEIGARYDDRIIIFDAPPLLPTPQTQILTMLVGQIVFVVESGKTAQSVVMEALDMLPEDKATALLMNKSEGISRRNKNYYGYYDNRGS